MSATTVHRVRPVLRPVAIAAAFVNLGIHLALAPAHLAEMPYIGVLFVLGSALLGAVMVGLASDSDLARTSTWIGGCLICATEIVLFLLSRSTGLPGGYHQTWAVTPEDRLGLVSLAVEVVFIGCAAASLAAWLDDRERSSLPDRLVDRRASTAIRCPGAG